MEKIQFPPKGVLSGYWGQKTGKRFKNQWVLGSGEWWQQRAKGREAWTTGRSQGSLPGGSDLEMVSRRSQWEREEIAFIRDIV